MAGGARKQVHDTLESLTALRATVGDSERAVLDQAIALLSSLGDEVSELSERVRWLIGAPYRKKAEAVPPGQLAMDLLNALAFDREKPEPEPEPEPEPVTKKKNKRKRRGKELPVKIVEARLTGPERACNCCGEEQAELGFDTQRRFVYEPAKIYTLEERRFKYACRQCDGGVSTAPPELPAKPIPGSMASASVLAFLVVGKILDGLPIERIARKLRRHGVDLATSTLNDWFGNAARMLAFLHRLLRAELRQCELISLDDTPLKAQNRDPPKTMTSGRQWLYLGDVDQVAYAEFTEDWKGKHPRAVLDDFDGSIQGDGYAGINPLFVREGGPTRVGCNDHARRKFVAAFEHGDSRAQPVIDIYRALYAVEREATERGLDAAGRTALRQTKSAPLWQRLERAVGELAPQAGSKSPLGKAVVYFERQLPTLKVFLTDGRLPISNAHVERLLRLVGLFRKNSLFVGSVEAGQRYAVLLSLVLQCVLVGANPYDYLVDVIDKVANDWPNDRAAELLPGAWQAAREREQQLARDPDAAGDSAAA